MEYFLSGAMNLGASAELQDAAGICSNDDRGGS